MSGAEATVEREGKMPAWKWVVTIATLLIAGPIAVVPFLLAIALLAPFAIIAWPVSGITLWPFLHQQKARIATRRRPAFRPRYALSG